MSATPSTPWDQKRPTSPGLNPERERKNRRYKFLLAHNLTDGKWDVPKNKIYNRLIYGAEKVYGEERKRRAGDWDFFLG